MSLAPDILDLFKASAGNALVFSLILGSIVLGIGGYLLLIDFFKSESSKENSGFDLLISPDTVSARKYLKELIKFKSLGFIFSKRDFLVRFRHTAVGLAWIILKPALLVFTLSFVFGKLTGFDSKSSIPYPLVVLAGLLPWQFFAAALADTTSSLVVNQHIVAKTYFPRMILPIACLFNPAVDIFISFILFGVLMLWYSVPISWHLLALPLFMLLLMSLCLGLGLWLSALNARFRDIQHLLPFGLQIGMYLSPVGYTFDAIPVKWQLWYNLNPLVGVIEGFRWSMLGGITGLHYNALIMSSLISLLLIVSGFRVFRKLETSMVDKL